MGGKSSVDTQGDKTACSLLEEALDLFRRCLIIQENEYQQFQAQLVANAQMETTIPENVKNEPESSNISPQANELNEEERWVSVIEPVTKDSLVDTLLALFETLSVLCSRSIRLGRDAEKYLHTVGQFVTPELLETLSMYASDTERDLDAAVGHAGLISVISETKYRGRVVDFRVIGFHSLQSTQN